MNTDRWVDDRLASLDEATEWQPDAVRGRARLREWDRQAKIRGRWAWVAAAAATLGLLAFVQPRACATPRGCVQDSPQGAAPKAATPETVAPTAPVQPVKLKAVAAAPRSEEPGTQKPRNYKEAGSPDAAMAVEVYSDYQCPDCTNFFNDIMPQLMAEYIKTGKVKLLHRDFPLPQHQYAKLAARYANAAGQAGEYDLAIKRIFETQSTWRVTGDLDAQLATVLSPLVMNKVRGLVANDPHIDDTMTADFNFGLAEGIHHTPSVVIVWNGKRELIEPIPTYSVLKSRIDALLGQ